MSGTIPEGNISTSANTQKNPENAEKFDSDTDIRSENVGNETLDSLYEYELIESENTVLLKKYIGKEENLTVYGSYKIGGKEYKTRLRDGTH